MRAFRRFSLVLSLGVTFLLSPWISQPANAVTTVNCSTGGSITIANNAVVAPVDYGAQCSGSVTIPAGVLLIPNFAFTYTDVTTVNIPASVTSIGNAAFADATSLLNINVTEPNATYTSSSGVLFNNDRTYLIAYPSEKRVETYTVPAGVTTIGDYAFDSNNFYSLVLPTSVSNIEAGAFRNSALLEVITVTEPNANFSSSDGVLFNNDETVLSAYPSAKTDVSYSIPSGVTAIEDFAFYRQKALTYLSVSSTVRSIGLSAFSEANDLRSVTLGSDSELESISEAAFADAQLLSTMEIPNAVKMIGSNAFRFTDLPTIVIPTGLESIGVGAFSSMYYLQSITVDESNSNYTSLDGVLFDDSMSTLITYPLARGRHYYTIPTGVVSIAEKAFSEMPGDYSATTRLGVLTISPTVASIGKQAFAGNVYLYSVTFESGSGLITIGASAFAGTNITSFDIPASVTSIGDYAFARSGYDGVLESVAFESGSQLEAIGAGAFEGAPIPTIAIPASVTSIGDSAFASTSNLESVTFESGSHLTTVGSSAFQDSDIPTITIPASVTSIGDSAFMGTDELKSVKFGSGSRLETIGSQAFYGSAIQTITIPASVKSIGNEAFSEMNTCYTFDDRCSKTTFLFSPGFQLSTIGNGVFAGTYLGTFTVPASVTSIGSEAFADTGLTSLRFETGSKLTSIGSYAFSQTSFSTIIIPAGVKSIGEQAFASHYFESIYFLGKAPTVVGNLAYDTYSPGWPKAYVRSGSTGFSKIGKQWKGLTVAAMPTTAIVKPSLLGAAKVSQTLVAKSGEWIGYTTPKLSYQWYSCPAQVKSVTSTIPKTCKIISKATKSTLAITKTYKGKYLAVLVTGKGTGTTATKWLSKSTTKVS